MSDKDWKKLSEIFKQRTEEIRRFMEEIGSKKDVYLNPDEQRKAVDLIKKFKADNDLLGKLLEKARRRVRWIVKLGDSLTASLRGCPHSVLWRLW